jgi:hypothetical protein
MVDTTIIVIFQGGVDCPRPKSAQFTYSVIFKPPDSDYSLGRWAWKWAQ